jgi:multicomponent Na+:H+ antiporter subunit D
VNWNAALPVLIVCSSLVPGLIIFTLGEERVKLRTILNIGGAIVKLALLAVLFVGYLDDRVYETRIELAPGAELVLAADPIALLFISLSAVLWLITTVFAIGYLEGSPHRGRFFGFFSLAVTATMGIALAGNLLTFFIFYELLTLTTYPLVVHRGTPKALAAGRTYLAYTLGGGAVLLVGVVWMQVLAGPLDFTSGGAVGETLASEARPELIAIYFLLIAGCGVKAALVPVHGWLPQAMVAPAPVSALLHAVAVVKAGVYGIVRITYDLYGIEVAAAIGVLTPLAIVAAITIIYGSLRALTQDDLKRRLAYSTVSQLSYITLGVATVAPLAMAGALVHLVNQGLMKVTLFFCAGSIAETLGKHKISELSGVGARMPVTMTCFTICAFGMIGVPPVAGFVSKWYLGLGGLEAGSGWVLAVLLASSVLNAAYFLPIVARAWFGRGPYRRGEGPHRFEAPLSLVGPTVCAAALALAVGLFAGLDLSPLGIALDISQEEFAE